MADKENKNDFGNLILGAALAGAVVLTADFIGNRDRSVIGKFLRTSKHEPIPTEREIIPTMPAFGEPSTSMWEKPVPTLRKPIPTNSLHVEPSGALPVPNRPPSYEEGKREAKHVKQGLSEYDIEVSSWKIANSVFEDLQFQDVPTRRGIGDTQRIHADIVHIFMSHHTPEAFIKLAKFLKEHGHRVYERGSPLYSQQQELVRHCADLYMRMFGVERQYEALSGLYDDESDGLAASNAVSTIHFNVAGSAIEYD